MSVRSRTKSSKTSRSSSSSHGRQQSKGSRVDIDELLEENLSLKYQVQKLQAVLSSGQQGGESPGKELGQRSTGDHDDDDDDEKFKHQIKRLQFFMNNHSEQSSALKAQLKDASEYVESLEQPQSRKTRAGPTAGRVNRKGARSTTPVSEKVRLALGNTYSTAKQSVTRPKSRRERKQAEAVPVAPTSVSFSERKKSSGRAETSKKKPGSMGQQDYPFDVTSEDLAYIFDEVVNLKHKLAQAESKLKDAEVHSPSQVQDETLKQEMKEMKETQQTIQKQIKAQQEVLTDIFQQLSGVKNEPDPLEVYRTRYPVFSIQPTVRENKGVKIKVNSRKSPFRSAAMSRKTNQKFSLLAKGYSSAYVDDPNYVERALNLERGIDEWEDFR